jgi:hypothetical protein
MWDAFVTIFKEEGFLALMRGLPMRLIYVTPSAAVSFALYEQFKRMLRNYQAAPTPPPSSILQLPSHDGPAPPAPAPAAQKRHRKYEPLIWLTAGASARLIGTAIRTPFDIVKQRMQVQGSLTTPRMLFTLPLLFLFLFFQLILTFFFFLSFFLL